MRVKLFTRDRCRYCEEAKALLRDKKIQFSEIKIETSDDRDRLKREFPGARTYPVVVIDDVWIGGFTQLQEYIRTHK